MAIVGQGLYLGNEPIQLIQNNNQVLANPFDFDETPPYITDGLIYYVDAGNTSSYPGSGTTWTDLSGAGRTTTLTNGPTFDSANGGSINFDGTNDYAVVASGFNPNITTKTMLGWCKLKNVSQQGGGLIGAGFVLGFELTFDAIVYNETNDGWGFGSNNFARTFWSGVKETSTDDWVMITAVYAAGTNAYKMYRQDLQIAQGTQSVLSINNANSGYWVGKRHTNTPNGPLNAYIAVGMIYDRALTADEITQNYNHFKGRFGL
jgi:hypothetical protein